MMKTTAMRQANFAAGMRGAEASEVRGRRSAFGQNRRRIGIFGLMATCMVAAMGMCGVAAGQTAAGNYQVTNLLSDGFVPAAVTDAKFIDPWGISIGRDFWINTNVSGLDYVALTTGGIAFKVTIPPAAAAATGTAIGTPTGTIFNSSAGFLLANGSKASFLFCSLDGTISGWNGALGLDGSRALIAVNNSAKNAVYTDMALLTNPTGSFILVSNFGQGAAVEVYDSTFKPATLAGSFTDPNVPAGYAPYSVHTIGSQVFVTYTLRSVPPFAPGAGTYQETLGTDTGFVSVFDVNGNFVKRAVTGGNLNAPWGIAIAPANWGIYGGALLVGNFGDGLINAYDAKTFGFLGQITDGTGKAVAYPGLWELVFGTATYGDTNGMYFSAGLAHETHGLFGVITNGPTTTAAPSFGLSVSSPVATAAVGGSTALTVSVAPTNAFSGTVNLTCTGLPAGATCSFASSPLVVSSTAPGITTVTIQSSAGTPATNGYIASERERRSGGTRTVRAIAMALMLPFGMLLAARRGKGLGSLRMLGAVLVLAASSGLIAGCYSAPAGKPAVPGTPSGLSNVVVTATSGATTRTTTIGLTVK